nr:hypothetical protein Iba_chr09eCG13950 [Ipomoea batatas]GME19510.1 hypothetical protein Iba_scaffold23049CG0010 [Ipomoea batatas]
MEATLAAAGTEMSRGGGSAANVLHCCLAEEGGGGVKSAKKGRNDHRRALPLSSRNVTEEDEELACRRGSPSVVAVSSERGRGRRPEGHCRC